jgi:hypothetical protein
MRQRRDGGNQRCNNQQCRERPRGCRAAEQRDELAPSHSITSSACASNVGGTLCAVLDARTYMLALSKDRERRAQWQRAAELLLAQAEVADFSKQIELALFYDAKLDVAAMATGA